MAGGLREQAPAIQETCPYGAWRRRGRAVRRVESRPGAHERARLRLMRRVGMGASARSVLVFGVYLLGLGLVLLIVPNMLLSLFGMPTTTEVWVRVVGMLVIFLGYITRNRHAAA
jgi:hypothetical protein